MWKFLNWGCHVRLFFNIYLSFSLCNLCKQNSKFYIFQEHTLFPSDFCQIILHSSWWCYNRSIWPTFIIGLISSAPLLAVRSVGGMLATQNPYFSSFCSSVIYQSLARVGRDQVLFLECCSRSVHLRQGSKEKAATGTQRVLGAHCWLPSVTCLGRCSGSPDPPSVSVFIFALLTLRAKSRQVFTGTFIRLWPINKY